MQNQYSTLKVIGRTVCLTIRTLGISGIAAPVYYVVEALAPSIMTVLSAKLFDHAVLFAEGKGGYDKFWYFFGLIVAVYIIREIMMVAGSIAINASVYEKYPASLRLKLVGKFTRLSLIDYERPNIYDMCQKAKDCVTRDKLSAVFMVSAVIVTNAVGMAATILVVATYNIFLLPISVISVLPYMITQKFSGKAFYAMEKEHAGLIRRTKYLWRLLTSADSEKELHLNDAIEYVSGKWRTLNCTIQAERYEYECKAAKYHLFCMAIQTLGSGISIWIIVLMVIYKQISIGEFGACIIALGALQGSIKVFLTEIGQIDEHIAFAADFFRFMDLPEAAPVVKLERFPEEIELKNVSFSYPASMRKALSDITYVLKRGKHIALVGENGCGKSTLIKLITGVYKPDDGEILLNVDDKVYQNANISQNISVVLQEFIRYYLTLRENVAISDISHMSNTKRIKACLKRIHAPMDDLEGRLGAQFGGREYSGGQWQRIAISRGIFRDRGLFILDEPTSTLDPMAEAEVLKLFLEIMKGRTSLIVSHRIGLCRYVDEIVVMKQGHIVEIGSHIELLKQKGEYYRLYEEQSKWYRSNKNI